MLFQSYLLGIFVITLVYSLGCGIPSAKTKPAETVGYPSLPGPRSQPDSPALPIQEEGGLINTEKANEFAKLAAKTHKAIKGELEKLDAKQAFSNVVGLSNCGNTCYMNSLLQALLHSDLGRYTEVPFNQINFAQGIDKDKSLFKLFYDLALDYRSAATPSISTQKISAARETFMPLLEIGQQADADEYLGNFFNRLAEELNVVAKRPTDNKASDEERANFPFQYNWVQAGKYGDYSIVQALFGGYQKSILNKADNKKSIDYELITRLQLSIPKEAELTGVSLENLLNDFSKEQALSDSPGNKSRQLLLYKAPRNLIIHLKRFEYEGGKSKKITTKVSYPEMLTLNTPADGSLNFDLFAIVLHSGSLSGGHYTAQIKMPDNSWSYVSDESVNKSNSAAALGQQEGAYMLFYKKRLS